MQLLGKMLGKNINGLGTVAGKEQLLRRNNCLEGTNFGKEQEETVVEEERLLGS
jgi:hypothetical protein